MTESKYRQFEPNPGEVWSSSYDDPRDEPTVYYFVEKLLSTAPSTRFASHNTWRVIVLESGSLEAIMPTTATGAQVQRQFDGVSTGYGPSGREHDVGYDSYDNCYMRLA